MRFSHHYVFAFWLFLCTEDSVRKKKNYEASTLNGHCMLQNLFGFAAKLGPIFNKFTHRTYRLPIDYY